jgi:hypothetical protein
MGDHFQDHPFAPTPMPDSHEPLETPFGSDTLSDSGYTPGSGRTGSTLVPDDFQDVDHVTLAWEAFNQVTWLYNLGYRWDVAMYSVYYRQNPHVQEQMHENSAAYFASQHYQSNTYPWNEQPHATQVSAPSSEYDFRAQTEENEMYSRVYFSFNSLPPRSTWPLPDYGQSGDSSDDAFSDENTEGGEDYADGEDGADGEDYVDGGDYADGGDYNNREYYVVGKDYFDEEDKQEDKLEDDDKEDRGEDDEKNREDEEDEEDEKDKDEDEDDEIEVEGRREDEVEDEDEEYEEVEGEDRGSLARLLKDQRRRQLSRRIS